jgi:hypothetical protein
LGILISLPLTVAMDLAKLEPGGLGLGSSFLFRHFSLSAAKAATVKMITIALFVATFLAMVIH